VPSNTTAVSPDGFPVRLSIWLAANADLVAALVALRRLGPEGAAARQALLDVKRVATMRLSLALWSELIVDDGDDPDALLGALLPVYVVRRLRFAVGGTSHRSRRCTLRAVVESR
jgi:hypothetical protein